MATLYRQFMSWISDTSFIIRVYLALWYIFQPPPYLLDLAEPKQSLCLRHSITAFLCLAMRTRRKQHDASQLFSSIEDFSLNSFRHSVHRIYIVDPER